MVFATDSSMQAFLTAPQRAFRSQWPEDFSSPPLLRYDAAPQRAGEAEAATERKPSCFPAFASLDDFVKYVKANGQSGAKAASSAARGAVSWLLLVAAGAAVNAL
jgi:hypothetical protein